MWFFSDKPKPWHVFKKEVGFEAIAVNYSLEILGIYLFPFILENEILPVQGVSCALRGWDGNTSRCRGGGREEEKGWRAATKLGLSDTRLTASLLLRQEMHFPLHMLLFFPRLLKNFRIWWGFFAATSTTCLIPFARGEACPGWPCHHLPEVEYWAGIDCLARLPRGAAVLVSWDPATSSYSLPWEMKREVSKITKLLQEQSGG